MNRSGGLLWHARALWSGARWRPACEQIEQWLESVTPRSGHVLLLGASAGWMLPTQWLTRFERIDAWDIDPWAGPLFGWRHGSRLRAAGVQWSYHQGDALAQLPALLKAHPDAAVFFDNLLGQLRFHAPAGPQGVAQVEQRLSELRTQLTGREWGSIHDLLSGPAFGPSAPQAMRKRRIKPGASASADPWLHKLLPSGPWLDHLTSAVFPVGTAVNDIAWPFKPGYWHWLQAGWVEPPGHKISP